MNKTRAIQIVSRILGVVMISLTTWLYNKGVIPESQPDVQRVAQPLAAGIVAVAAFWFDFFLHRKLVRDVMEKFKKVTQ